jgi:hypothetical protein
LGLPGGMFRPPPLGLSSTRILDDINGQQSQHRKYFAADSLKEASDIGIDIERSTFDYVARQTQDGLPPHCLEIKTNGCLPTTTKISNQLATREKHSSRCHTELGTRIITVKVFRDHLTLSDESLNEKEIE